MFKHVTATAALLAAPVAMLAGCSNEKTSEQPSTSTTTSAAPRAKAMAAELKSADGKPVAKATIDFAGGFATVTVETTAPGILSPGFHGMHIHSMGRCEADSVAPTGGSPGAFNSAGGHLQVGGRTEHPASGDLTSLEVRSDGTAKLVTTTNAFTENDLKGPEGSALIIHQDPDNFAHIPERYTQNGVPGADAETLATGDAGGRVACAVLAPASTASTFTSTSTSTSTVTETTGAPVPPAVSPTTTTTSSPATNTTTTTVTPTTTVTTAPPAPGNP